MSKHGLDQTAWNRILGQARRASKDDGATLDLSDQRIDEIPAEVVERLKLEVTRLALGHNILTALPPSIVSMQKLRYLNIRSNYFREFPTILCNMPSLEILDISRNKIRSFPQDPGNLIHLKVLSISKNRIEVLPNYISRMHDLKILKIEYNPIVFPSSNIVHNTGGEATMDQWLTALKSYLAQQTPLDVETGTTTDDDGQESDYAALDTRGLTVRPYAKSNKPTPPIPTKNMDRTSSKSVSGMAHFIDPKALDMERSRSNSESEHSRPPYRRPLQMQRTRTGLDTLTEDRTRHSRGFSHDYINGRDNVSEAESSLRSPAEVQQNSRAYFRRLSSLPQSKRVSLSSAKIVESARGMLFAFSQIHQAVRQYSTFCPFPDLTGSINRVLYNANAHVGALVDALESHEAKPDNADATVVMEACRACVGAFRHVMSILHNRIRDLTSQADVRYTRTLLLLLYGAAAEIQNAWTAIRPVSEIKPLPIVGISPIPGFMPYGATRTAAPLTRLKSNSNSNVSLTSFNSLARPNEQHGSSIGTPPSVMSPDGPVGVDTDEQLLDKIAQATSATLALLSLMGEAVSKSAIASSQGPNTPGAVSPATNIKLRDLASNSLSAGEVTRRLKNKLPQARSMTDAIDKKRFWEDTNAFVKAVINVAALAKSVSSEYPFSKAILASLSTVTRSTKELTILLSVSTFQLHRAEPQPATTPSAGIISPLAAALGPASQAVMTPTVANMTAVAATSPTLKHFDMSGPNSASGTPLSTYQPQLPPFGEESTT
ncbi:RAM signaling pathway protein-domain-containing protein [Protomyces lactucae-debilis]|uniref:RAM signaling pathway protein-domain-containing protein n=1 Tax=Protomyces lactucae-debilis TaxID=2754530 RepID=A0A1Y2FII9_PROLT|nr:RAM signaling pathway protein-domain-containing protein [Protomyces lactucae-debilis]ORY83066.1 RAM signaling pathway protein-domain-containing protein [Protomyces lactucae-debilis]